jgi:hypothetical protein
MGVAGSKSHASHPDDKLLYAFTNEHFTTTPEYKFTVRSDARLQFQRYTNQYQQALWLLNKYDMPHVNADMTLPISDFEKLALFIPRADGLLDVNSTSPCLKKYHLRYTKDGCTADFWALHSVGTPHISQHPAYKTLMKKCNPSDKLTIRYVILHGDYRSAMKQTKNK